VRTAVVDKFIFICFPQVLRTCEGLSIITQISFYRSYCNEKNRRHFFLLGHPVELLITYRARVLVVWAWRETWRRQTWVQSRARFSPALAGNSRWSCWQRWWLSPCVVQRTWSASVPLVDQRPTWTVPSTLKACHPRQNGEIRRDCYTGRLL